MVGKAAWDPPLLFDQSWGGEVLLEFFSLKPQILKASLTWGFSLV